MCIALILWRSALRLLIGKLSIFDIVICPQYIYFTFRTITSESEWIFSKFDLCIDIVEICFRIAHGQILSIFDIMVGCCRFTLYNTPANCVYISSEILE